jgi:hypothetical protein
MLSWIFILLTHWNYSHFILDQHAQLDLYIADSLKQQSAGWHVGPHIIPIPNQKSLLLLRNTACLVEKQQLPIFIVLDITWPGLEQKKPRKLEGAC